MKDIILTISILVQCFLNFGCSERSVSFNQYLENVHRYEKNLTISDSVFGLTISAEYLPPLLMALREARSAENLRNNYKGLTKNYEDADYFELTLSKQSSSTKDYLQQFFHGEDSSQTAFEQYIDFGIQRDIKLLRGRDTLACAYLHREISDALTNKLQYTISFELDKSHENLFDRTIYLNSKNIGLRNVNLLISVDKIRNIPTIKNVHL